MRRVGDLCMGLTKFGNLSGCVLGGWRCITCALQLQLLLINSLVLAKLEFFFVSMKDGYYYSILALFRCM
jgi:hypothetical protein